MAGAAVAAAAVLLAGCGSGASAGSGSAGLLSQTRFRHAYVTAESTLRSISAALAAAGASSHVRAGGPGAGAHAAGRAALATRAEQEASALEQLGPPPRYNTEVRDIASALNVSASDLDAMSTAVAARDVRAVTGAAGSLRADAVDIRIAAARLAGSLGRAPAS